MKTNLVYILCIFIVRCDSLPSNRQKVQFHYNVVTTTLPSVGIFNDDRRNIDRSSFSTNKGATTISGNEVPGFIQFIEQKYDPELKKSDLPYVEQEGNGESIVETPDINSRFTAESYFTNLKRPNSNSIIYSSTNNRNYLENIPKNSRILHTPIVTSFVFPEFIRRNDFFKNDRWYNKAQIEKILYDEWNNYYCTAKNMETEDSNFSQEKQKEVATSSNKKEYAQHYPEITSFFTNKIKRELPSEMDNFEKFNPVPLEPLSDRIGIFDLDNLKGEQFMPESWSGGSPSPFENMKDEPIVSKNSKEIQRPTLKNLKKDDALPKNNINQKVVSPVTTNNPKTVEVDLTEKKLTTKTTNHSKNVHLPPTTNPKKINFPPRTDFEKILNTEPILFDEIEVQPMNLEKTNPLQETDIKNVEDNLETEPFDYSEEMKQLALPDSKKDILQPVVDYSKITLNLHSNPSVDLKDTRSRSSNSKKGNYSPSTNYRAIVVNADPVELESSEEINHAPGFNSKNGKHLPTVNSRKSHPSLETISSKNAENTRLSSFTNLKTTTSIPVTHRRNIESKKETSSSRNLRERHSSQPKNVKKLNSLPLTDFRKAEASSIEDIDEKKLSSSDFIRLNGKRSTPDDEDEVDEHTQENEKEILSQEQMGELKIEPLPPWESSEDDSEPDSNFHISGAAARGVSNLLSSYSYVRRTASEPFGLISQLIKWYRYVSFLYRNYLS